MKIMSNDEYYALLHKIEEQKTVIEMKNDIIDSQKAIIYDLIEENKSLRNHSNNEIDCPNSSKSYEDKLF